MSNSENIDDSIEKNIEYPIKIKVLHISDDDSSKTFGELLKTKTSRNLIQVLKKHQMYVNQMHKEQNMRVSLVTHHLNKLIDLGFVNIEEKPISKKTKDHRYFDLEHDAYLVLVAKEEGTEEFHKYSILKKIFKESVKLSCVAIAGVSAWLSSTNLISFPNTRISTLNVFSSELIPLLLSGIVVGIGLFIIYYSKKHK